MLYSFELVMLGVLLLGAMVVCGSVMLWRRRRAEKEDAARGGHAQAGA